MFVILSHGIYTKNVVFLLKEGEQMNDKEIVGKVHNSMYHQLKTGGVAVPVQVLMDIGVLSKEDYEKWRYGKVDYLERVCKINLRKLSSIMREVRVYAKKNSLKPSWTFYKQWGKKGEKPSIKLQFSKSGDEGIERGYATHYVDTPEK